MLSNKEITDMVLEHMDVIRKKQPGTDKLTPQIAHTYMKLYGECLARDNGTISDKFSKLASRLENRFIERYM